MRKKLYIALLAIAAISVVAVSCHKDKSVDKPFSYACKVSTVTDSSAGFAHTYNLTYKNGKVVSIIYTTIDPNYTSYVKTIIDTNNVLYITTAYSTGSVQLDTVYLNHAGYPTDDYTYVLGSGAEQHTGYVYDSKNELINMVNVHNDTTFYVWSGGDLRYALVRDTAVSDTSASAPKFDTLHTYSYFSTMPARVGDFMQLNNYLLYTLIYVNNTHLLMSDTQLKGTYTINYSYGFDTKGNVARIQASNGFVYNISYNCK